MRYSVRELEEAARKQAMVEGLVTESAAMRRVARQILKVASFEANVLLEGETGVGKEVVARAIHRQSRRCSHPFVAVHCGAIPRELVESELFGFERGAFTGAFDHYCGRVEMARGGTLFLDEIATMDLGGQVRLLRLIQDREIVRLGGTRLIQVDVRFIAATNCDLEEAVRDRRFREDLYYRLNVFPIHIPPLRERREDIPYLVGVLLRGLDREGRVSKEFVARGAVQKLFQYPWPGNVRELKNLLERASILEEGKTLTLDGWRWDRGDGNRHCDGSLNLRTHRRALEKRLIEKALCLSGQNKTLASQKLGITPRALRYKLKAYGLSDFQSKPASDPPPFKEEISFR